jgi:hypothetical protein
MASHGITSKTAITLLLEPNTGQGCRAALRCAPEASSDDVFLVHVGKVVVCVVVGSSANGNEEPVVADHTGLAKLYRNTCKPDNVVCSVAPMLPTRLPLQAQTRSTCMYAAAWRCKRHHRNHIHSLSAICVLPAGMFRFARSCR